MLEASIADTLTDDIADFLAELGREEVADKAVASYRSDLAGFARWFDRSTGRHLPRRR